MTSIRIPLTLVALLLASSVPAAEPSTPAHQEAAAILAELLDYPSLLPAGGNNLKEQHRTQLYERLKELDAAAVAVLSQALHDQDVEIRRRAALALTVLAADWYRPLLQLDVSAAVPDLITTLLDPDDAVRTLTNNAIAAIGPKAAAAVPTLLLILEYGDTQSRSGACLALSGIGPAASAAIPAVRRALGDPSEDVRHYARLAIGRI